MMARQIPPLPLQDHRVGSSPGEPLTMRGMVNPMMGTMQSMVEGRERSEPSIAALRAGPSTPPLRVAVPLPRKAGGGA
jgi:hypothetical protein